MSLRRGLLPVVICCVSGSLAAGWPEVAAAAENLPALRVDPALVGERPTATPTPDRASPTATEAVQPASPASEATVLPVAPAAPPAELPAPAQTRTDNAAGKVPAPTNEPAAQPPATDSPSRNPVVPQTRPLQPQGMMSPPATGGLASRSGQRRDERSERPQMPSAMIEPRRLAAEGVPSGTPPERGATTQEGAQLRAGQTNHERLPPPALRRSQTLAPVPRKTDEPRPTFIAADRITGQTEDQVVAEGNAELRRIGNTLKSDWLTYRQDEDEVEGVGNVRLTRNGDVMSGPKLRLKLEESVGFFEQPEYSIQRPPRFSRTTTPVTGTGHADRIDFEGENQFRLKNATYSTCGPNDPDWYAKARELQLDYDREVGEARDAKVVFKGVPIMYTPWADFPLNDQRKTGLLAPTIGSSSKVGTSVVAPWYWNIAPNRDATIAPRLMTRRGLQLNGEFRYLAPNYAGTTRFEYLPKDLVIEKRRSAYSVVHNQNFGRGFAGALNLNGVSDDTYYTDLGTRIALTSQTFLLRQGTLSYSGGWWNTTASALRYQTLQDPILPPITVPYDRLPQVLMTAKRPEFYGGTAFAFNGEYVDFTHPTFVLGKRFTLYPQLSLPLETSAFYVTPKVGYQVTHYNLSRQTSGTPESIDRSVPIYSVDSGVYFERDVTLNSRALIQTLEPRLYYLRVPFRDQNQIPVFDTALADFNFTQLFSENLFIGGDRIADANQLTSALTSRLVDPSTGVEIVRAALGQRYYFRSQSVTLPGVPARTARNADILAALSGQILPHTFIDTGWQYNPRDRLTERFNVGTRYQPEAGKLLNAGYRFTRNVLREIDLSGQWPLFSKWSGVGRYNFSLSDHRLIEAIAGLEYDGGCWVARAVMQRFAIGTQTANTAFFVQLELNGLSRIGSNPLDLLRRSIRGYGQASQPTADPVFGAE